jgi:signal transduction histidine kinase
MRILLVNLLLSRLGEASRTQRQFMADAAHELRTPVSVIKTAADVTLDRPHRHEWEYREALTIVTEQSSRVGRMVAEMPVGRDGPTCCSISMRTSPSV